MQQLFKPLRAIKFTGKQSTIRLQNLREFRKQVDKQYGLAWVHGKVHFFKVFVGKRAIPCMAVKIMWRHRSPQEAERNSKDLNNIRLNIPELKSHIPPTVRVIKGRKRDWLLLTDLTQQGRFEVKDLDPEITDNLVGERETHAF